MSYSTRLGKLKAHGNFIVSGVVPENDVRSVHFPPGIRYVHPERRVVLFGPLMSTGADEVPASRPTKEILMHIAAMAVHNERVHALQRSQKNTFVFTHACSPSPGFMNHEYVFENIYTKQLDGTMRVFILCDFMDADWPNVRCTGAIVFTFDKGCIKCIARFSSEKGVGTVLEAVLEQIAMSININLVQLSSVHTVEAASDTSCVLGVLNPSKPLDVSILDMYYQKMGFRFGEDACHLYRGEINGDTTMSKCLSHEPRGAIQFIPPTSRMALSRALSEVYYVHDVSFKDNTVVADFKRRAKYPGPVSTVTVFVIDPQRKRVRGGRDAMKINTAEPFVKATISWDSKAGKTFYVKTELLEPLPPLETDMYSLKDVLPFLVAIGMDSALDPPARAMKMLRI